MKNEGKIFAFEKDQKRFRTLRVMLARARVAPNTVQTINADFLSTNPNNYAHVSHMYVNCLNKP